MLNTINVNLNTDLKVTRVPELGIKIKSQDINNNLFILKFTDNGQEIELDETYTVEVLTKFEKSKSHRLTSATVYRDYANWEFYASWEFDTSFITQDEKVVNYVYVRKAGSLVVSADANAFAFDVGLSEIDKDAGRVAEVYDENYEKYLDEFKEVADFTFIQQAEAGRESSETTRKTNETTRISNENARKSAEVIRLANETGRVNAESVRAEFYEGFDGRLDDLEADKVVINNLATNGNFSNSLSGWSPYGEDTSGIREVATFPVGDSQQSLHLKRGIGSTGGYGINKMYTLSVGDKYYIRTAWYRPISDTDASKSKRLIINNKNNVERARIDMTNSATGIRATGSVILTTDTTENNLILSVVASDVLNSELFIDDVMLINLTKVFGSGKEPSKDQMDVFINRIGYFEEYVSKVSDRLVESFRLENTKASKLQEGWVAPTMLNGWVNYSEATYVKCGYYKDTLGIVHLRGFIKSGELNKTIFSLPSGYQPEALSYFPTTSLNAAGTITVASFTGNVTCLHGNNTWLSLDGITFKAHR